MFSVNPYKESALSKKNQVKKMFDRISFKYDFLNALLSFKMDFFWRRKVTNIVKSHHPNHILDLATGTGDLAIAMAKKMPKVKIDALDLSPNMLAVAKKKLAKEKLTTQIELFCSDSQEMPFENERFDLITVAFGIRNFENVEASLEQMHSVLKKQGKLIILEFSQPKSAIINFFYNFYSKYILSNVGKWISKEKEAYTYLYKSAKVFPSREKLKPILEKAGFCDFKFLPLSFGVVCIYEVLKK